MGQQTSSIFCFSGRSQEIRSTPSKAAVRDFGGLVFRVLGDLLSDDAGLHDGWKKRVWPPFPFASDWMTKPMHEVNDELSCYTITWIRLAGAN